MDHCKNMQKGNFEIDWKKPLVAEGIVVGYKKNTVDIYIDPNRFPHRKKRLD